MRPSSAGLAAALLALAPAAARADEKSVLTILFDGKKAGMEEVAQERLDDGIVRDSARVRFKTPAGVEVSIDAVLTLQEDEESLRPVLYAQEATVGGRASSVKAVFEEGHARGIAQEGDAKRTWDVEAKPTVALLETNRFHPFRALYRRYDLDKGGVQTVPALVPSAGVLLEARLEGRGAVKVKRGGAEETVERVSVTLGDLTFDLYGTPGGRFLFLRSETQHLMAATEGYEDAVPREKQEETGTRRSGETERTR